ncbi:MAG: phosphoribosyltransferase family protein [Bacteroidota bacterium]
MSYSFRRFADAVAGLVYPSLCLGCDRRVAPSETLPVCARCLQRIPTPPDGAALAQIRQREAGVAIRSATALWAYDESGTAQRVQYALKYGGQPSLGHPLGALMANAWRDQSIDSVIPVPLSRPRFLERGYNQSDALAEGLSQTLGVPHAPHVLVRSRPTRTQTRLSASERWSNVSGAFSVPEPGPLAGQRVLLVDDVLTTGATLTAAAHVLAEAGATVEAAVLAFAG